MNRHLFLLLGIAILVIATSWLTQRQEQADGATDTDTRLADYFIKGFSSTATDEHGRINQRLTATTLYHYPDTDITTLEQPDISVSGKNGIGWHATAEHGEFDGNDEKKLLLRDDVVLRQRGEESLTLHTTWLSIEGERHYAETDAPIRIESAKGRIEGTGLNLYGDEQRLIVRNAVRGHYEAR